MLRAMGFARGKAAGYGTLQRVVSGLAVEAFEEVVFRWAEEALGAQGRGDGLQELAVDGKVLATGGCTGSRQGNLPAEHLVSIVAQELGITLAQGDVPPSTHEAKAVLPLLADLSLTNCVLTGDSAFMQREVCTLIIKQQGHYLIVLKDNQPDLSQSVRDWFEPFPPSRRVPTPGQSGA